MNNIYFIEPYNAYVKKKAKTPQEEIFEQNVQAEMIAKIMMAEAQLNATLPQQPSQKTPSQATPTIGGTPAAGAGGQPVHDFFAPPLGNGTVTISPRSPSIGPVTLKADCGASRYATVEWNVWTTGSTNAATRQAVVSGYLSTGLPATLLTNTGSYRIDSTASYGGNNTYGKTTLSASTPEITAGFTFTPATGPAPLTVVFTNASTNNSPTPSLDYVWTVSGSLTVGAISPITTSVATNPTFTFYVPGTYVVKLGTSSSYYTNLKVLTSSINTISASIA